MQQLLFMYAHHFLKSISKSQKTIKQGKCTHECVRLFLFPHSCALKVLSHQS